MNPYVGLKYDNNGIPCVLHADFLDIRNLGSGCSQSTFKVYENWKDALLMVNLNGKRNQRDKGKVVKWRTVT